MIRVIGHPGRSRGCSPFSHLPQALTALLATPFGRPKHFGENENIRLSKLNAWPFAVPLLQSEPEAAADLDLYFWSGGLQQVLSTLAEAKAEGFVTPHLLQANPDDGFQDRCWLARHLRHDGGGVTDSLAAFLGQALSDIQRVAWRLEHEDVREAAAPHLRARYCATKRLTRLALLESTPRRDNHFGPGLVFHLVHLLAGFLKTGARRLGVSESFGMPLAGHTAPSSARLV
jgi:hypothetical protein